MTLAKRIRDHRYAMGWGPDELASRAEISRTALYQIECGKTEMPRAGTLRRIAEALGVSIDALRGHDEGGSATLGILEHRVDRTLSDSGSDESESGSEPGNGLTGYSRTDAPASRADGHESAGRTWPGGPHFSTWGVASRERELERKFQELLLSPLGEGVARIVEESHRLLPPRPVKHST